jgi:hypothetical protein
MKYLSQLKPVSLKIGLESLSKNRYYIDAFLLFFFAFHSIYAFTSNVKRQLVSRLIILLSNFCHIMSLDEVLDDVWSRKVAIPSFYRRRPTIDW